MGATEMYTSTILGKIIESNKQSRCPAPSGVVRFAGAGWSERREWGRGGVSWRSIHVQND